MDFLVCAFCCAVILVMYWCLGPEKKGGGGKGKLSKEGPQTRGRVYLSCH
jgi:hypothetical protein